MDVPPDGTPAGVHGGICGSLDGPGPTNVTDCMPGVRFSSLDGAAGLRRHARLATNNTSTHANHRRARNVRYTSLSALVDVSLFSDSVPGSNLSATTTLRELSELLLEWQLDLLGVPATRHTRRHRLTTADFHPEAFEAERARTVEGW